MILELGKKSTKGIGRKWGLPKHQDTGFTPFCAGGESTRTLSSHHPVLVVSWPGHWVHTTLCWWRVTPFKLRASTAHNSCLVCFIRRQGQTSEIEGWVQATAWSAVHLGRIDWLPDHSAGCKVEFTMIGGVILVGLSACDCLKQFEVPPVHFLLHNPSSLSSIESPLCFKPLSPGSASTAEEAYLIMSGPQRIILYLFIWILSYIHMVNSLSHVKWSFIKNPARCVYTKN